MAPPLTRPTVNLDPDRWVVDHQELLLRLALRKVSSREIAEDLVQETFLSAWKGRERFRGDSSERTFLVTILRNKIADHYRRAHTRLSINASAMESAEDGDTKSWIEGHCVESEELQPQAILDRAEFRKDLDEAVARLPEKMRRVFQLRELDDQTTGEIVEAMNLSRSNLWVLVHRARHALREDLASAWDPRMASVA